MEEGLAAAAARNDVVGSAASGSEPPADRAQADLATSRERTKLNVASPKLTSMAVEVEQNATPPVWTGKSPAYVCRDLVMLNLAHYVKIEMALSTGAQLREQKRAADGTATGIRQMKDPGVCWHRQSKRHLEEDRVSYH